MSYILILGARSDMAKAIAHKFAKNGFNLYLAARRHEELKVEAKDLEIRYEVKAKAVEFDALDFNSHHDFYHGLTEKPVGVVCVVGLLGNQKEAEKNFDKNMEIINTNYIGCMSIINIISNDFEEKQNGFIIGISSVAGDRGRQSNYYYGSAKAAFTAYLSGLRNRLDKSNVRVITVKPGYILTSMTEDMELPSLLTGCPDDVAGDIYRGWKKGKDIIYTQWFWRYIMLIIRNIPEIFFKKMSL